LSQFSIYFFNIYNVHQSSREAQSNFLVCYVASSPSWLKNYWLIEKWSKVTQILPFLQIKLKTSLEEIQSVTLNDRRNTRLSFVKANKYKVGLNLVKNRLHSVTIVVDTKWMDLSLESYKLECKKRIIQNSLLSL